MAAAQMAGGGEVNNLCTVLPTDDALLWRFHATRFRNSSALPPSFNYTFRPGGPLQPWANCTKPNPTHPLPKTVRFSGDTDPAASWRTLDAALAGAGYNRLLQSEAALNDIKGAPDPLRETVARPLSPLECGVSPIPSLECGPHKALRVLYRVPGSGGDAVLLTGLESLASRRVAAAGRRC